MSRFKDILKKKKDMLKDQEWAVFSTEPFRLLDIMWSPQYYNKCFLIRFGIVETATSSKTNIQ